MREIRTAKPPTRFESVAEFLQKREGVRGTVEIQLGDLPLHFFYDWRGVGTTFVTFSGSSSPKVKHVPAWAAKGTTDNLGVNRVLISDPSIILHEELRLGWYAGNRFQTDLQDQLTTLVTGISEGTRLIMFGPSGGGFTSLFHASRIPGATAIVSNPQTDFRLFTESAVRWYLETAWNARLEDLPQLPLISSVLDMYDRDCVDAKIIYLQNEGDHDHVQKHLQPFLNTVHQDLALVVLRPYLGEGHLGPDKESFVRLFETVVANPDWNVLTDKLRDLPITRNIAMKGLIV